MKIKKVLAAGAIALTCLSGCHKIDVTDLLPRNSTLPDFSVIMDNGESVNLLTLFGTPAVLCTFDTSNPDCQKLLPLLQTAYEMHGRSIKFVLISGAEGVDSVVSYWDLHGFSMPYSAQDSDKQADKFSKTRPRLIIVDDNFGTVAGYKGDDIPNMEQLTRNIEKAIKD